MDILFVNNAKTLLDGQILNTDLSAEVDDGSLFPSPTGGQYFYATLQNPADDTDYEIIKATARSSNTITIERAQEGTSAQTWADGTLFELRLTAGGIDALKAHEADHLSGGSAEIDGDALDIDFSPSYYTPSISPTEVTSVSELTAHLYGIDQAVKPATQDARGTIELATHTEAKAGSETGMAITPSSLTAVLKQQSWSQDGGYFIGTDTIRARDSDGLNVHDDGGYGLHIADGGVFSFNSGQRLNRVAVNDADRIGMGGLTKDFLIAFTALTASRTYQISSEDIAQEGRRFIVKDESGAAGTYPIIITTEGDETIDGNPDYALDTDHESVELYSDGSNLHIF